MRSSLVGLVLFFLTFVQSSHAQMQQQTIDFENFEGSSIFDTAEPPLQALAATFSGGEILSATTFAPADETTVYGTSFFCGGCSPTITIQFSQRVSNFSVFVVNGQTFTVTYTVEDDQGNSRVITLVANFDAGAGTISLPDKNVRQVTIASDAGGEWDFLIDDVTFTPATGILIDPVQSGLLRGPAVTTDTNAIADFGYPVQGVSADGATQAVVEIPANSAGQTLTLAVINDQGGQSTSTEADGGLVALGGDPDVLSSTLEITAMDTDQGPIAFAIYRSPLNFWRGSQDAPLGQRMTTLRATAKDNSGFTSGVSVLIVRPPVILIHGLWDDQTTWNNFAPLVGDSRFFIRRVDYSALVSGFTASVPSYGLQTVSQNALGFAYNAPSVMAQIKGFISEYASAMDVAAVQADVVGHSMGGDIARTLATFPNFLSPDTYGLGPIDKLITIGTPHLGTPLATQVLQTNNDCVAGLLALRGKVALQTATVNGTTVNGAVGDLQGDGFGGGLSTALSKLSPNQPFVTAYIAGTMNGVNLAGLNCTGFCGANVIRFFCATHSSPANPLATNLTAQNWPNVFGQASDAIVPLTSELNNGSSTLQFPGVIHSAGVEGLDFNGPSELDPTAIPTEVISLLNEQLTGTDFQR